MAFGPPPSKEFTGKFGVAEDLRWRAYIKTEKSSKERWQSKWGWILDEYSKLKKDMDAKSAEYIAKQRERGKVYLPDKRTIKPVPESVSHQIGWLSSKKEFRLEIFGPDVDIDMPFKSLY